MEKDWVSKAIERQAIPRQLRTETVAEFCQREGIAEETYYWQMRKPENQQRILDISLTIAKESAPEILKKLAEQAEKGDVKAIDIYIDSILKLAKNVDVKSGGKPIPILGYVSKDNSSNENPEPKPEN